VRTRVLVGCLLPLALAAGAACSKSAGGRGVASIQSARPNVTVSLSDLAQATRWARCMRAHGVPIPDPVSNGHGDYQYPGDKGAIAQAGGDAIDSATNACKALQPVIPPDEVAAKLAQAREEARCMRAHGVENYPDPNPDSFTNVLGRGGGEIPESVHQDPQFPDARAACIHHGGAGPSPTR
jgi:hypothetical protein